MKVLIMKILIYDDSNEDVENLKNCLDNFMSKKQIAYQVDVCQDSNYFLQEMEQYDLIFLDVELKDENGIELGMQLRNKNIDTRIIITSSYAKYLIDGYKIQADRYFIKPINQEDFDLEMEAVLQRYYQKYAGFEDERISPRKIYYHEIMYIEFLGRKTLLHLSSNKVLATNYPLKYWFEKLKDYSFGQSHKSFIVNFDYIDDFTNMDIKLTNQELVPVSRRFKKQFIDEYTNYLHRTL